MVAVQQPRADCGHVAALTQQCGRCLRWCCPECYLPWTALACSACRAEARAAAAKPRAVPPVEVAVEGPLDPRCRDGCRGRARGSGVHRQRDRSDVRTLVERVAALERRLQELRPGG